MIRRKKNLKGFVFTLDAIFALIVAAVGVSILLYVDFTSSASYTLAASEAPAILQSMLGTTVSQAFSGSAYLNGLSTATYAATYPWNQFGHDSTLSSGTGFSVQAPYLLYTFNSPYSMLPFAAIGDGLVAVASGNKVYLLNATTGEQYETVPSGSSTANVVSAPAIGMGMLYYANASNSVKGVSINDNSVQWSFNAGNSIVTPIEIEGGRIVFGTSKGFYLLDPINGNQIAYGNVNSETEAPLYLNGEYVVSTQSGIYSYSLGGGALVSTWNAVLPGPSVTPPSSTNDTIAVGSGHHLYVFTPGGANVFESNDLLSNVLGISAYGGIYYVQTANAVYDFTSSGSMLFDNSTETNMQGFAPTPSSGQSTVYVLVNGNTMLGYDTVTDKQIFNVTLPSNGVSSTYSQISLAYGNMYVPSGNTLYVFGTYKTRQGDSMLKTLAEMYLNSQGDYSDGIMQELYNSSTTGIFINNTYAPDLSVATFNSAKESYVEQAYGFEWMNSASANFTISIWVDPTSVNGIVVGELGQRQLTGAWRNGMISISNGIVYANISTTGNRLNLGSIPTNTEDWSNIVLTYDGRTEIESGYIDGSLRNSTIVARTVPGGSSAMYYPLGAGLPNNYFSGSMLDFQIYNETLDSVAVASIYQNGAFSAPPHMGHTRLWLPLVGNSNDFSSSFDFGTSYNVEYSSSNYLPVKLSNAYQISTASVPMFLNSNGKIGNYSVSVVIWR